MNDEEKLRKIFRSFDIDGDGVLNAAELLKAFEKIGQKPTLAQIQQMIEEIDTDKNGTVNFKEFQAMWSKVQSGQLPSSTGIAKLIKSAWETYIEQINKEPEKNKMMKGKGSEYKDEAPQGEKYKLGSKKKGYKPGSLPPKKNMDELLSK